MTRRRGADPLILALAAFGGGALAVLILLGVLGALGLAVLLAGAGVGGYVLGQRGRRPLARRGPSPASRRGLALSVVTRAELDRQAGLWAAELARLSEAGAAELAAVAAERDDLARQAAGLRGDLAAARESAALAWDAAASAAPPRPRADPEPPELAARLLADPLSGVRRLGPG